MVSRNYITALQANVRRLQAELMALEHEEVQTPDAEYMARGAGLIKFHENDESRFLGPSSGIGITRFVMELAKANTTTRSIHEVIEDRTVQHIKQLTDRESAKPTSKIYPLISSVAAPNLPTLDLMEKLMDIYMAKSQSLLPLLHEPSFRQEVRAVYQGSDDPVLNFQLRLVLAVSMQKLDTQYAGLADSYYLAALPYLQQVVKRMDVSTLQCFALIGEYSVLTPTRTASYWVVGLAVRLCQDLGLCDETTIREFQGVKFNELEIDLRRRLYWIIVSMEFGLAHTLGRPSAFGVSVDNLNVNWFELCDDRYIAAEGLLEGNHPIMKKCLAIHFFKMRLIQAEIRRTLYLRKRNAPMTDEDPWFSQMMDRIHEWIRTGPVHDEGSGVSELFKGRSRHLIVFLYRPSPQIPEPSLRAARHCYDSSAYIITVQKHQIEGRLVDYTWILTQTMFMALNTILWTLSYPEIRAEHSFEETQKICVAAVQAIELTADRWPGVQSASQLYANLVSACLRAYDTDLSFVLSSSATTSPASTQEVSSPPSLAPNQSPVSTAPTSLAGPRSPPSRASPMGPPILPVKGLYNEQPADILVSFVDPMTGHALPYTQTPVQSTVPMVQHKRKTSIINPPSHYSLPSFDLGAGGIPLPGADQKYAHYSNRPNVVNNSGYFNGDDMDLDNAPWLGHFGDGYSHQLHQTFFPGPEQMQLLDQQQQSDLMASLERDELPDMSLYVSDAFTYYPGHNTT